MRASPTPERSTPFVTQVYDPDDVLTRLALDPFIEGELPVARRLDVAHTAPLADDDVAVDDGRVTRRLEWGTTTQVLVEGTGWTAVLTRRRSDDGDDATTSAWMFARSTDRLDDVAELLRKALGDGGVESSRVAVRTWNERGGWSDRSVVAPEWPEMRRNYAAAVRPSLDQLVALTPEAPRAGRLILLHGVPGTGKSTFIRALARAWRSWCGTEVLSDARSILGSSHVLEPILFTPARGDDGEDRPWKLIVVEDAHELVDSDAAGGASDSLTRLLHATDGVVGGQARVLFLLTTNHHLGRVHPALLRAGRCLAEIEIPPLTAPEAAAWLGLEVPPPVAPTTLAELYARHASDHVIRHRVESPPPGQYL